ncbi:unnamed protein product [Linum trigynum]|uniref:Tf2-1-like SH3-like domain-containing protein n=1 Tax=Linum trigynum TaxID=586398 RepID=A0AAV2G7B4_9ROSI
MGEQEEAAFGVEEGDMVMVKFYPHRFKHLKNVQKGLLCRYEGSFPIVKRIGKVEYKVEIPSTFKDPSGLLCEPTHGFNEDKEDERPTKSHHTATLVTKTHNHEVQRSWHVVSFLVVAFILVMWSTWSSGATF